MNGTKKLAARAARPSGNGDVVDGDGAPSSARVAPPRKPLSGGGATANDKPLDDPAAAGDEVDDEQVERFYALLANIRAMRRVYTPAAGGSRARKRLRGAADPPWKPVFRLEDFDDDATSATSRWARKVERSHPDEKQGDDPVVVVASPSLSEPLRKCARRVDNSSKSI